MSGTGKGKGATIATNQLDSTLDYTTPKEWRRAMTILLATGLEREPETDGRELAKAVVAFFLETRKD